MRSRILASLASAFICATLAWAAPDPAADPEPVLTERPAYAESLVGKPVPDWGALHFVDGKARRPEDFRGKVMIVRFWTSNCPRCRASAATLRDWTDHYAKRGLIVVGIYLPKTRGEEVDDAEVRDAAKNIGLDAVIAADPEWDALARLWRHGGKRYSVSISLLVDRDGIVRAVHRGGRMAIAAARDQADEYRAFSAILRREFQQSI